MALSSPLSAPAAPQLRTQTLADSLPAAPGAGAAARWLLILGTGGACWLVLAALASLPGASMPLPPTSMGDYGAQQLLVFLTAAAGYRVTLTLGWPARLTARVRVLALTLLVAVAVAVLAPQLAHALIALLRDHPVIAAPNWGQAAQRFLPPYLLGLLATLLVLSAGESARARAQVVALSGACAGAQMRMLSAHLQPHFLLNALHAISVLVDDSPRRASAMIARLGDFLRHALESGRWPWTDLASELAGVEAYLAIQQMRFADSLEVSVDAGAEALGACVPALLLQPLVENAVEHGRSAQGARLRVHVAASVVGPRLCLVVGNSHSLLHADLSPADFGQGLGNVEQRLLAAYGEDARLTIGPDGSGGTAAFVDLPRRTFWPARSAARQPP